MKYVYETIIKSDVKTVFDALTDPNQTKEYYYGFEIEGDWKVGGSYTYKQNGNIALEGVITELIPDKKIAMTFNGKWIPDVSSHPETIVEYELWQEGDNTYLKMSHSGLEDGSYAAKALPKGWVNIISGMKTLIETGKHLDVDLQATMQNY